MTDRSVGGRIARLRREMGMSQAALAASTGVSRSAVAQWETDRTGQFSGHLARIASVLDVSVDMLLHGGELELSPGMTGDELALIRLYRECDAADRAELLRLARQLAVAVSGRDSRK